ncbi:hypothetical protein NDU88_001625 [Pleurodeles waltl]|uniref:Uncharacterized protein n=1 Tax=Pleurodeles waltl TaxID=8319 RepID=A0AAV7M8Q1_PLEWA|nr:hypothetical protein NDU88_001625 [Pleurodeles waltl]
MALAWLRLRHAHLRQTRERAEDTQDAPQPGNSCILYGQFMDGSVLKSANRFQTRARRNNSVCLMTKADGATWEHPDWVEELNRIGQIKIGTAKPF